MLISLSNRATVRVFLTKFPFTARGIDVLSSRLSRDCQADGGNGDQSNKEGDFINLRAVEGRDLHRTLGRSCGRADSVWICMLYNEEHRAIAGRCWWVHLSFLSHYHRCLYVTDFTLCKASTRLTALFLPAHL